MTRKATTEALPRGREEVRRAVIEAAANLLASRGPSAITVRDIAAAAQVNHGLVHRHFGSKEGVVRAVMEMLGGELHAFPAKGDSPPESLPLTMLLALGQSRYLRVLARALLDGSDVADLQQRFPVVDALLAIARDAKKRGQLRSDVDPRTPVAMAMALGLGWLLFEPFIVAAVGLKKSKVALRRDLAAAMLSMFEPTPPSSSSSHSVSDAGERAPSRTRPASV